MGTPEANRALIERFWDDLYRYDFDACGAYFTDGGVYTDVPVGEVGAKGPTEVAARLRLGLEPIDRNVHHLHNIVADGGVVMTEHVEEWFWPSGEHVALPFVSVMELRDGKITRWRDYFNLPTLLDAAPAVVARPHRQGLPLPATAARLSTIVFPVSLRSVLLLVTRPHREQRVAAVVG